jgi:hypothetical protein
LPPDKSSQNNDRVDISLNMSMMWGMENNDVPGRAGATRRAFLSASAVTAVAVPLLGGTALAETDPAISRQASPPR